jgi:hypothetical protein
MPPARSQARRRIIMLQCVARPRSARAPAARHPGSDAGLAASDAGLAGSDAGLACQRIANPSISPREGAGAK